LKKFQSQKDEVIMDLEHRLSKAVDTLATAEGPKDVVNMDARSQIASMAQVCNQFFTILTIPRK
jgi:hypothetical protein